MKLNIDSVYSRLSINTNNIKCNANFLILVQCEGEKVTLCLPYDISGILLIYVRDVEKNFHKHFPFEEHRFHLSHPAHMINILVANGLGTKCSST